MDEGAAGDCGSHPWTTRTGAVAALGARPIIDERSNGQVQGEIVSSVLLLCVL